MSVIKIRFYITGMYCAACSSACERALNALEGIKSAAVNLASETAMVEYDPQMVTRPAIEQAVAKAGYRAVDAEAWRREGRERQAKEYRALKLRFIVACLLAALLMYIAMAPMMGVFSPPVLISHQKQPLVYAIVQLALCAGVMAMGYDMLWRGFKNLFGLKPNMDSLVAMGTTAAVAFSVYWLALLFLGDDSAVHHLYFESAGTIVALVLLGRFLEQRSKGRTGEAVGRLMELSPAEATVLRGEEEVRIPARELLPGDLVLIRPGEKIPCDGQVQEGSSGVDEAMLSGESMPVAKGPGDALYAGTINTTGSLKLRAQGVGADTALARIIEMVEEAQGSKAPIARVADKISGIFVPVVMAIALVAGVSWLLGGAGLEAALRIFVSVMVIACPCALGLATPTAIIVGTGRAAGMGILFKNAAALETAHEINTVLLDKTGTLTMGKPGVVDVIPVGMDEGELMRLAAAAEALSEHPISRAVVAWARQEGLDFLQAEDFAAVGGMGITALVGGKRVAVGNFALMQSQRVEVSSWNMRVENLSLEGKTPLYVAVEGELAGILTVADTLRPDSRAAVERLKEMGIKPVMVTGDNRDTAWYIARELGIDEVRAQVLPGQKALLVNLFSTQGNKVAMVGDGLNDAVALTRADVGIAIGAGVDVALEAADIVLRQNRVGDVPLALCVSRATMRVIKQNLFWAFFYNIIGIPIAAGVLHLFGGPLLNPMIAAAAMSLSSVTVVTNALRLNRVKIRGSEGGGC